MRSELNPAVATSGLDTLERLLIAAQRGLPHAHTSVLSPITTARGLSGVRVQVDFTLPGKQVTYRRTHAVVVDEGVLVNVMYTARDLVSALARSRAPQQTRSRRARCC